MAKRKTRVKSPAMTVTLQSQDEVAVAIKQIGDLERELVRIKTQQADEKALVDEKYTAQLNELKAKVKPLGEAVQSFCESHRLELTKNGKQKTAYFTTGEVQWRIKPPSVSAKGIENILARLKELGLTQFIRFKEELNKDAMLADPDKAKAVAGITIKEGIEEFVIKPNDEEVR
ncbi:host-nuclease inhibitor Gam family protein [Phocoenobacter skyensis]|uniref:Host-nuclease inhibitor Gam family protein n=1 Tax=Phocoenobacter skyensis TaxID=97481 RepID=A0ABT9JN47_9PAST|nr:host-nuclease inhibitor Gam family protein [Pasteurella skyensis]MDP8080217.1 host-nuclease inhibitor Gam family protein [Pasteurella skyensis]MDP8086244.1 host-nuclease inhibitor Gam family protein [Pasteurella skyensis]